jgi:hypothetical protein
MWRGQARDAPAAAGGPGAQKPVPAPYMSVQYKEDAMRTTGAARAGAPLPAAAHAGQLVGRSGTSMGRPQGAVAAARSRSGGCGTACAETCLPCRCSICHANCSASQLHLCCGRRRGCGARFGSCRSARAQRSQPGCTAARRAQVRRRGPSRPRPWAWPPRTRACRRALTGHPWNRSVQLLPLQCIRLRCAGALPNTHALEQAGTRQASCVQHNKERCQVSHVRHCSTGAKQASRGRAGLPCAALPSPLNLTLTLC